MTQRDPAAALARAARNRTQAIEAAKATAERIEAERAETLEQRERNPVVTPEPLDEEAAGDG